ncbi:hypothetical protein [Gimesia fumaroli]|jgi:hypothetical protein|uniref:Uncharacterized protein n=1 Tax=Gimesia fumaroli TaxID=2527976 RepID=A0A518I8R2_9PLAN|nr:hypothetical protein [Gimesia fumaroli]QDV49496.1 hypothetical protein Enr17x_15150 [Gimesia fumaroli]
MTASIDSNSMLKTDTEQPTFVQKAGVGLMCFTAFLLLYFVMAGPLVWIEGKMKFGPFSNSVKTVYAPLAQVVESDLKPASTLVKSYVGLFKN